MTNVNLNALNDNYFSNYFKYLINQLYKSLCLKEEQSQTLISYLESFNRELIGNKELIDFLKGDARFISLISKIQFLISNPNVDEDIFRKEIFSSMSIVKKLEEKYL
jgi:hypothetical protein